MESQEESIIRRAEQSEVAAIVVMLADDPLGMTRESPGDPAYAAAFQRIDEDTNQILAVAERGTLFIADSDSTQPTLV